MSASFGPSALPFVGLFALVLTARAAVLFQSIDPGLLHIAKLESCSPQTIETISPSDRASCALACSLDPRCRAFLHSEPDHCELLSTPWRSPPTAQRHTLMMRRLEHPSAMTWRFNGSQYMVTKEKGNFTQMKAACAAREMHLWYPSSLEEMRFVEQKILCSLWGEYFEDFNLNPKPEAFYKVWIGVVDRPNGNCLLADDLTKCPVKNYLDGEPYSNNTECTAYWWKNGSTGWFDLNCNKTCSGLCEDN